MFLSSLAITVKQIVLQPSLNVPLFCSMFYGSFKVFNNTSFFLVGRVPSDMEKICKNRVITLLVRQNWKCVGVGIANFYPNASYPDYIRSAWKTIRSQFDRALQLLEHLFDRAHRSYHIKG